MKLAINSSMFARFEKFIYAETHGSGLNYEYEWRLYRHGIRLDTYYQPLDENGYSCFIPAVKVTVWFNLDETFKVRCRDTSKGYYGLREYLEDTFARTYGIWFQQEENMIADNK